jgi:cysteine desulfurase/selenocysteine lyase
MTVTPATAPGLLDVAALRVDFPILSRTVRDGKRLVYLDSGATSHKPVAVLDAERDFYLHHNSAVHRGAHALAEEATDAFESARRRVATFVGGSAQEVVFTKNATEAINLVTYSLENAGTGAGPSDLAISHGDEIVVTEMEHHANLVPWQQLCERTGARLRWFGVTEDGRLDLEDLESVVTERTKVVAVVHQSNVLGTVNPLRALFDRAHEVGALVLLDACQSVPHMPIDVADLGVDFLVFSGHKMLGPMGVGVLWGRQQLLERMPPFLTGGSMIERVTMQRSTFAPPPQRFEAGVPNVAQAVGLAAACDYLAAVGMDRVHAHEQAINQAALPRLAEIPGLRLVGPPGAADRGATYSFTVEGIHPHDLGQMLDAHGVAVRTGHHCAWPLHTAYGVQATTRASFYLYNDLADLDVLVEAIRAAQRFFGTV